MSGDERTPMPQPLTGDEGTYWHGQFESAIRALADLRREHIEVVAEVESLRASLNFKQGTIDDLAATVERLEWSIDLCSGSCRRTLDGR